jgi:F0F1-type ATP synthase membrane subunit b/b'
VETVKAEEARQVAAFEAALADARRKGAQERERLKLEALKAADEMKAKARAETKAALEMARGALQAEAGMAQSNLHQTASELALKMLSTVLRRKVA